jgi:hypothetical protein
MVEFVALEIFLKQIAAGADCVMLGSLLAERVSWRNYYFEGRKFRIIQVEWVL